MSSKKYSSKQEIELPDPKSIPLPEDNHVITQAITPTTTTFTKQGEGSACSPSIAPISSKDEMEMMQKMLGFSNFDSTKGKQVPGNNVGAVHVVKKRRYRQYMNRKGGFNRPLDKVA